MRSSINKFIQRHVKGTVNIKDDAIPDLIFEDFLIFSGVAMLLQSVFYAVNLNLSLTFTSLVAFIGILYIYIKQINNPNKSPYKLILLSVCLVFICVSWFFSEGILGGFSQMIPLFYYLTTTILAEKHRKTFLITCTAIFSMVLIIEYLEPNWIMPYETVTAKKSDIVFSVIVCTAAISYTYNFIQKAYINQNIQLMQQIKKQKELSDDLDSFVYKVMHDLRAPITSVAGLINILRNCQSAEEFRFYLDMQEKSLGKLDNFIREIHDYAHNQQKEITYSAFDFAELCELRLNVQLSQSKFKSVDWKINYNSSRDFSSDKERLSIILDNLISNSLNYYDANKPKVKIEVTLDEVDNNWRMTFMDNGEGIDPVKMEKIYDMFYRGHKRSEGSGIGLYIVKQTLLKMGGNIECSSEINTGTVFTLYFPQILPVAS